MEDWRDGGRARADSIVDHPVLQSFSLPSARVSMARRPSLTGWRATKKPASVVRAGWGTWRCRNSSRTRPILASVGPGCEVQAQPRSESTSSTSRVAAIRPSTHGECYHPPTGKSSAFCPMSMSPDSGSVAPMSSRARPRPRPRFRFLSFLVPTPRVGTHCTSPRDRRSRTSRRGAPETPG